MRPFPRLSELDEGGKTPLLDGFDHHRDVLSPLLPIEVEGCGIALIIADDEVDAIGMVLIPRIFLEVARHCLIIEGGIDVDSLFCRSLPFICFQILILLPHLRGVLLLPCLVEPPLCIDILTTTEEGAVEGQALGGHIVRIELLEGNAMLLQERTKALVLSLEPVDFCFQFFDPVHCNYSIFL